MSRLWLEENNIQPSYYSLSSPVGISKSRYHTVASDFKTIKCKNYQFRLKYWGSDILNSEVILTIIDIIFAENWAAL